jgi:hypothetical protein
MSNIQHGISNNEGEEKDEGPISYTEEKKIFSYAHTLTADTNIDTINL